MKQKSNEKLLKLMCILNYAKSKDGIYTTLDYKGRKKSVLVNSREFSDYITSLYFNKTKEFVLESDIKDCLKLVRYQYEMAHPTCDMYENRYAFDNGAIYIDIADDKSSYVKVDSNGYDIISCDNDEPLFIKDSLELPMIVSKGGESKNGLLTDLDEMLNLSEDDLFILKIWLITAMNPQINVPIIYLLGNAGTGKSTIQDIIAGLIDPSSRGLVNWDSCSMKDIVISLGHSTLVNFDNVSKITAQKSDLLCQTVTGGNTSYRALYTNGDEVCFDIRTRVTISSVKKCIRHSDLAQRTLYMSTLDIKDKSRICENSLKDLFEERRGRVFSEMLEVLSLALAEYPDWKEKHHSYMRLAEFDLFAGLVASIIDEDNGYARYRSIMKNKQFNQVFIDTDAYEFMKSMLDVIKDNGNDKGYFKGEMSKLYELIKEWIEEAPECDFDIDSIITYDRFSKLMHAQESRFKEFGYQIEFWKTKKNYAGITIEEIEE